MSTVPGPGEVLLEIRACGINFADTLMREGRYQEKHPLPFTPGLEVCGIVVALGPGADGPPPGTRVACYCGSGGLAVVHVGRLAVPAHGDRPPGGAYACRPGKVARSAHTGRGRGDEHERDH